VRGHVRFAAFAAVLFACALARAGDPPPAEVKEARRVIDAVASVLETSSVRDAKPAADALRDPSWIVRRVAGIRLDVLGLEQSVVDELQKSAIPGQPAPAETSPALAKARELAVRVAPKKEPPKKVTTLEAARIVAGVQTEEVQHGRSEAADKRAIVTSLAAFAAACGDDEAARLFFVKRILAFADRDAILKDLGAKTDDEAAAEKGKKILDWWEKNEAFTFLHKRAGRFLLDADARGAGVASHDYRKDHPWKPGEGPDAPVKPGTGSVR
jgi:hypothetical protein